MKPLPSLALLFALLVVLAPSAQAHFFVQPYSLPVPFSMYAWGASAALLASFIVVGLFASVPRLIAVVPVGDARSLAAAPPRAATTIGRALSLGLLLLCIVAGFVGSQNAFVNINMTLFWTVFVLGIPYAVALAGDFYAPLNPWKALVVLC